MSFIAPAQPVSRAREVSYAVERLAPPASVYIQPEDTIQVGVAADAAIGVTPFVTVRLLLPNGQIVTTNQNVNVGIDGSMALTRLRLPESFLLTASLQLPTGPLSVGRAYAVISLVRLTVPSVPLGHVLASGYLTGWQPVTFPGSAMAPQGSGRGFLRSIIGTAPAAGVEISETVPGGVRWRLISGTFILTTSAAVANRAVQFVIDDGANLLCSVGQQDLQPAGTTQGYTFGNLGQQARPTQSNNETLNIPSFILNPGWRFRTVTNSFQAADRYSLLFYAVEQWTMEA